jgi:hypothetical protein
MPVLRGQSGYVTLAADLGLLVAQVRRWTVTYPLQVLDATCMGDAWRRLVSGRGDWTAGLGLLLDYGDAGQAQFLDAVLGAAPPGQVAYLMLGSTEGGRQWIGRMALVERAEVVAQQGDLVSVVLTCAALRRRGFREAWELSLGLDRQARWSEPWEE